MSAAIRVEGMGGLGDCLHQRAVVRQLLAQGRDVWLETPWPSVYHDLSGERLHLVDAGSPLRTQAKNAEREAASFSHRPPPDEADYLRVHYPAPACQAWGSVLKAMLATCRLDPDECDFRLPVPDRWLDMVEVWLNRWGNPVKPLMIYRPLVARAEWGGAAARNPDPDTYRALYRAVRGQYFVVSVADLEPGREWLVSEEVDVDVVLHGGELVFEELAALFSIADLVFTAPGFAVVLSQAVGAKHVAVFGGYERARSYSAGRRFARQLAIEPIEPCDCFRHDHQCRKEIDLPAALNRVREFGFGLPPLAGWRAPLAFVGDVGPELYPPTSQRA
ncbi:hypothetical protein LRS10_13795 [Phenylobacterium sp. J426]|uniref:hypothetical protein n=1 Tax=Phenylobacterium sp. J426 TaxID=2898439 RepID=UPI0021510D9F|nr:hypothetical protein [Phenylobacterium sp. J426]MCR5875166.1 hypothetical protein [Phenylobacterium sp. J426]